MATNNRRIVRSRSRSRSPAKNKQPRYDNNDRDYDRSRRFNDRNEEGRFRFEDRRNDESGYRYSSNGGGKPCWAWENGQCQRGDSCRFTHGGKGGGKGMMQPPGRMDESRYNDFRPPEKVCFDFEKGECHRGSNCRFLHNQRGGGGGRGQEEEGGSHRVFVASLDFKVTSSDLGAFMEEAGVVTFAEVFQDSPGRSKGFGIVDYRSLADAEWAIRNLNDRMLFSRKIFVRKEKFDAQQKAPPPPPRHHLPHPPVPFKHMASDGSDDKIASEVSLRVYVGNIDYQMTSDELKTQMETCGKVKSAFIIGDSRTGRSKGCAVVEYFNAQDAAKAIRKLHDSFFGKRKVFVREDRELNSRPPPRPVNDTPQSDKQGDKKNDIFQNSKEKEEKDGSKNEEAKDLSNEVKEEDIQKTQKDIEAEEEEEEEEDDDDDDEETILDTL